MPFFEGAEKVHIHGGEFTDVKGSLNKSDYSKHTHYLNSNNTTKSTTAGSYNNSSTRAEGRLCFVKISSVFNQIHVRCSFSS